MIEIGFAKTYKKLVDDIKMWIKRTENIRTVILIKIKENPRYCSPISELEDDKAKGVDFSH